MPVLIAQIPLALNTRAVLSPESTPALATKVAASGSFVNTPTNPYAPPPKHPQPLVPTGAFEVRPVELLRQIGIAMLPPRHVAQNLASWHWTLLRYAYLIEASPGANLGTNGLAGDYRYHHMMALSEAFGIGCALTCARRWLETQIPTETPIRDPIDLDYVLHGGPITTFPAVRQAPHASRQPDYLLMAEQGETVRLLVVECKGNSTGRSRSIEQLGSAMHQLEGVGIGTDADGPVAIDKHAYATRMTKDGGPLEVLAIDPPSEGEAWIRPKRVYPDQMRRTKPGADEERRPSPWEVAGLALAGLDDAIQAWAGVEEIDIERAMIAPSLRESDFGDVIGAASVLRPPTGMQVEVFTGALLESVEASRQRDSARAHERRVGLRRSLREASESQGSQQPRNDSERRLDSLRLSQSEDPERVASALGEDGTVLRIEAR